MNLLGDYRFERKFLTTQLNVCDLERLIKLHPACFREIFKPRQVNNIYFDTPHLTFFEDNVAGKNSRKKVRIRWYGKNLQKVESPVLEFKLKEGLVGLKNSYKLPEFELPERVTTDFFHNLFKRSEIPPAVLELLFQLEPQLLNHYQRSYYLSFDKGFRMTLDSSLEFYNYRPCTKSERNPVYSNKKVGVLELKYATSMDERAAWMINQLPIRMTKSSKYVSGIFYIRPDASN